MRACALIPWCCRTTTLVTAGMTLEAPLPPPSIECSAKSQLKQSWRCESWEPLCHVGDCYQNASTGA
eukprot:675313-Amphidinium_carterae.1